MSAGSARIMATVFVAALAAAGCEAAPDGAAGTASSAAGTSVPGVSPSPVLIPETIAKAHKRAMDRAQVRLPDGARVVGSHHVPEPHDLYAVVISPGAAGVEQVLHGMGFRKELAQNRTVGLPAVPGFSLEAAGNIASGQDAVTQALYREVLVDRTDPDNALVHVWVYRE